MATLSSPGSRSIFKANGYSLAEALISVMILGILATITIFDLRAARRTEELDTAVRLVASDVRAIQASALAVSNVKFCLNSPGDAYVACELGTSSCQDPADPTVGCVPRAPAGVGVHFDANASTYSFYGKYDPLTVDWTKQPQDVYRTRDLSVEGASNVVLSGFEPQLPAADVAFLRQNGTMRLNACENCADQDVLTIHVKHNQTNQVRDVILNRITGRVSIK